MPLGVPITVQTAQETDGFGVSDLLNPVDWALQAISLPGRVIQSTLAGGIDILQGEGVSPADWWQRVTNPNTGFGTDVLDNLIAPSSNDLPIWHPERIARIAGGFAGELVTDPLSYIGAPGAKMLGAGGARRLAAMHSTSDEKIRLALRLGTESGQIDDAAAAAIARNVDLAGGEWAEARRTWDDLLATGVPDDAQAAGRYAAQLKYQISLDRILADEVPERLRSRVERNLADLAKPGGGVAAVGDEAFLEAVGITPGLRLRPAFLPTARGVEGGTPFVSQEQWVKLTAPFRAVRGEIGQSKLGRRMQANWGRTEYATMWQLAANPGSLPPQMRNRLLAGVQLLHNANEQLDRFSHAVKQDAQIIGSRFGTNATVNETIIRYLETPRAVADEQNLADELAALGVSPADVAQVRSFFGRTRAELLASGAQVGNIGDTYVPWQIAATLDTAEARRAGRTRSTVGRRSIEMHRRIRTDIEGVPIPVVAEALETGIASLADDGIHITLNKPDLFDQARFRTEMTSVGRQVYGDDWIEPEFVNDVQDLMLTYADQATSIMRRQQLKTATVLAGLTVADDALQRAQRATRTLRTAQAASAGTLTAADRDDTADLLAAAADAAADENEALLAASSTAAAASRRRRIAATREAVARIDGFLDRELPEAARTRLGGLRAELIDYAADRPIGDLSKPLDDTAAANLRRDIDTLGAEVRTLTVAASGTGDYEAVRQRAGQLLSTAFNNTVDMSTRMLATLDTLVDNADLSDIQKLRARLADVYGPLSEARSAAMQTVDDIAQFDPLAAANLRTQIEALENPLIAYQAAVNEAFGDAADKAAARLHGKKVEPVAIAPILRRHVEVTQTRAAAVRELALLDGAPQVTADAAAVIRRRQYRLPHTEISVDPRTLGRSPERFQFKTTLPGDAQGVVPGSIADPARQVESWSAKSGAGIVWEDLGGTRWVVDGHQRAALAGRLLDADPNAVDSVGEPVRFHADLLRAADGWTEQAAFIEASITNIIQGSGTVFDWAQFGRRVADDPAYQPMFDRMRSEQGLGNDRARRSAQLMNLNDEAWAALAEIQNNPHPYGKRTAAVLVEGDGPARWLAPVGRLPAVGDLQTAVLTSLWRDLTSNPALRTFRYVDTRVDQHARDFAHTGLDETAEVSMFGDMADAQRTLDFGKAKATYQDQIVKTLLRRLKDDQRFASLLQDERLARFVPDDAQVAAITGEAAKAAEVTKAQLQGSLAMSRVLEAAFDRPESWPTDLITRIVDDIDSTVDANPAIRGDDSALTTALKSDKLRDSYRRFAQEFLDDYEALDNAQRGELLGSYAQYLALSAAAGPFPSQYTADTLARLDALDASNEHLDAAAMFGADNIARIADDTGLAADEAAKMATNAVIRARDAIYGDTIDRSLPLRDLPYSTLKQRLRIAHNRMKRDARRYSADRTARRSRLASPARAAMDTAAAGYLEELRRLVLVSEEGAVYGMKAAGETVTGADLADAGMTAQRRIDQAAADSQQIAESLTAAYGRQPTPTEVAAAVAADSNGELEELLVRIAAQQENTETVTALTRRRARRAKAAERAAKRAETDEAIDYATTKAEAAVELTDATESPEAAQVLRQQTLGGGEVDYDQMTQGVIDDTGTLRMGTQEYAEPGPRALRPDELGMERLDMDLPPVEMPSRPDIGAGAAPSTGMFADLPADDSPFDVADIDEAIDNALTPTGSPETAARGFVTRGPDSTVPDETLLPLESDPPARLDNIDDTAADIDGTIGDRADQIISAADRHAAEAVTPRTPTAAENAETAARRAALQAQIDEATAELDDIHAAMLQAETAAADVDPFDDSDLRDNLRQVVRMNAPERSTYERLVGELPAAAAMYSTVTARLAANGTENAAEIARLQQITTAAADPDSRDARLAAAELALRRDAEEHLAAHMTVLADRAAAGITDDELGSLAETVTIAYNHAVLEAQTLRVSPAMQQAALADSPLDATQLQLDGLAAAADTLDSQPALADALAAQFAGDLRQWHGITTPTDIAEMLDAATTLTVPSKFRSHLQAFNSWWRGLALMSPGYHTRNTISAFFSNLLAGVTPADTTSMYREARAYLTSAAAIDPARREYIDLMYRTGRIQRGRGTDLADHELEGIHGSMNPFAGITRRQQRQGQVFAGVRLSREFSQNHVENTLRLASGWGRYQELTARGASPEAAANAAKAVIDKFHFDYNNLSNMERGIRDFGIPFWTWQSRNLPLMLQTAVSRPQMILNVEAFFDSIGAGAPQNPYAPEWFSNQHYQPISQDWFLAADIPHISAVAEIDKLTASFGAGSEGMGLVGAAASYNPFIKSLVELGTGREASYGYELRGTQPWTRAFANLLPPWGQIERLTGAPTATEGQRGRIPSAWLGYFGIPLRIVSDRDKYNSWRAAQLAKAEAAPQEEARARQAATYQTALSQIERELAGARQ